VTESLALDRERAIQSLCAHYGHDHLTTQELELRFGRVYEATSDVELRGLLAGLPALPAPPAAGHGLAPLYSISAAPPSGEKRHLVVMSELKKRGQWTPARVNTVLVVAGAATFDLRDALLARGDMNFDVTVVMGEVKFIVPPGVRVESDGFAFMGAFDHQHSAPGDDADAPIVRISGSAVMGSLVIKTRLPGESALKAWSRRLREPGA
jgi:hypothetical protein